MDFYADVTPLVNPTYSWVGLAPFEPKKQGRKVFLERTEFANSRSALHDFFSAVTGPRAPTEVARERAAPAADLTPIVNNSSSAPAAKASEQTPRADVERVARQRVQLMAAKYAGGPESSEIMARLEILNRRLSESSPRVSKDHVLALEQANEQLAQIRAAREERARRLGITV